MKFPIIQTFSVATLLLSASAQASSFSSVQKGILDDPMDIDTSSLSNCTKPKALGQDIVMGENFVDSPNAEHHFLTMPEDIWGEISRNLQSFNTSALARTCKGMDAIMKMNVVVNHGVMTKKLDLDADIKPKLQEVFGQQLGGTLVDIFRHKSPVLYVDAFKSLLLPENANLLTQDVLKEINEHSIHNVAQAMLQSNEGDMTLSKRNPVKCFYIASYASAFFSDKMESYNRTVVIEDLSFLTPQNINILGENSMVLLVKKGNRNTGEQKEFIYNTLYPSFLEKVARTLTENILEGKVASKAKSQALIEKVSNHDRFVSLNPLTAMQLQRLATEVPDFFTTDLTAASKKKVINILQKKS